MALNFEQKKAIVVELSDVLRGSASAIAADYRGLSVLEMTELRKVARSMGVLVRVYKNTLARRVVKDTAYACLDQVLTGPIVLLFSLHEPGAAARLVRDFIKVHEALEVKGLVLDGQLFLGDKLKEIAKLPNQNEALSSLLAVMLAPVSQFVRTMKEPIAQVVRVFDAVRCTKEENA